MYLNVKQSPLAHRWHAHSLLTQISRDRAGSENHAAKSSGAAGKRRSNSSYFVLKPTHPMRAQLIPTISDKNPHLVGKPHAPKPSKPCESKQTFPPWKDSACKSQRGNAHKLEHWEIYHGSPCTAKGWLQICLSLPPTSLSQHHFQPLLKASQPGHTQICIHALKITKTTNPHWSKAWEVQAQLCFAFP